MESAPIIKLKKVFKDVGQKHQRFFILNDIDLKVSHGAFLSIMGPSGAGKSTLLHILGMLEMASEGEYYFMDQAVHELSEKQRTEIYRNEIGFVFQQFHLVDDLTVYENIELPLLYKKTSAKERKSHVCDMLDRFQIVGKKDLFPEQLSGGQQQLVAIARAIVANPSVIFADEPTGNLHSDQGREIMELLKKLNTEGTTIIQVTHSETNAAYSDEIIRLVDGRIETPQ
ncbi:MAG: ABC transporter ATP-binding protein [Opitutales bacterium]|nr:ABC transporter ATP-binding protein [Opitutales bacterium]